MEKALRQISVEQGHDPRDFILVSFGGAGPLHACALARALQIPKVLVPGMPGALSAYGILVSDIVRDYSRTVMLRPSDASIADHLAKLEEAGMRDMQAEGLSASAVRSLDLRYAGQGYELTVDWCSDFVGQFHRLHEQRYGYADPHRAVEVVNARVRIIARTEHLSLDGSSGESGRDGDGGKRTKRVYYEGQWLSGTIYDRSRLRPGDRFEGPAVVVEYSATTFVPPRCYTLVDEHSNMVIEVQP
jgi:N-methylhydantoinase A